MRRRQRDTSDGPRRFLVTGDVHGHFELLAEAAAAARASYGRLDAILAVGDVEANRDGSDAAGVHGPDKYRTVGDFPLVVEGLIDLGAPLYFIGGNHEPWPALDEAGAGPWSPGVHFLGRAGVDDVAGLRVAYLSGIHSPRISHTPRSRRETPRDRTYYTIEEVERVARAARRAGGVDVLLTHDWPSGISGPWRGREVGRPELRELCRKVRPRWHFCGHMHHRHEATVGDTRVLALGHIRTGPDAFAVVERTPAGALTLLPSVPDQAAPRRAAQPD